VNSLPVSTTRATGWALVGLLLVAAAWGSSFPLTKVLLGSMSALNFLAVRFVLAALVMAVMFFPALLRLSRRAVVRGAWLGLAYGVAQIVQTIGLQYTPASVSGFITGMYVVCTPLFAAVLLRTRIGPMTWVAVGIAVTGLGILTLSGFSVGYGEALTLVAAMVYALHIVGLGAWSSPADAIGMSILQCCVIAVVCTVAALPGGIVLPQRASDWVSVVYMALFAGAAALLGQTWAQAHLPPTRSAIIMSMEPVFAAFFAVLFGNESLTNRMLVGGGLVLTAMLIVELVPRRKVEAEVTHIAV
jgi:drug/metabolite transporter (DMT)-like permease